MTKSNTSEPAIRVVMMPRDTNPMGTIFGGIILSYIAQAGAVQALRHTLCETLVPVVSTPTEE